MNKKVVGGNYYVLVYYKNASAPDPEDAVLCNTLSNEIFFLSNHSFFVLLSMKFLSCIFFLSKGALLTVF